MTEKAWTIQKIKAEVRRMDPTLKASDPAFRVAVIMLSAIIVGQRADRLVKFTGYLLFDIRQVAKRMRENGLWLPGGRFAAAWAKDGDSIAFWLDVLVGMGHVERRTAA